MKRKTSPYAICRPPSPVDGRDPVRFDFAVHDRQEEMAFDMHYLLEMGVVLEGRIRRFYGPHEEDLPPGGTWFHGVWEGHGFRILRSPCRLLVITVWPELLALSHFPEAPGLDWMAPFRVRPALRPRLLAGGADRVRVLESEWRALAAVDASQRPVRKHLALRSLLLDAMLGWNSGRDAPRAGEPDGDILNRAVEMVFSTRDYLSELEAARRCRVRHGRFRALFRELMGIGFRDFALRHRLDGAARELRTSQAPVKAVALAWGFVDPSHFLRTFRRHYGATPANYRGAQAGARA